MASFMMASQIVALDDELDHLFVRVAAQRVGERHVAHRLVVPGVAAADERARGVAQAAAVVAELVAAIEVLRLGQARDVERVARLRLGAASAGASARRRSRGRRECRARRSARRSSCTSSGDCSRASTRQQAPHWLQRFMQRGACRGRPGGRRSVGAGGGVGCSSRARRRRSGALQGRASCVRHLHWRAASPLRSTVPGSAPVWAPSRIRTWPLTTVAT